MEEYMKQSIKRLLPIFIVLNTWLLLNNTAHAESAVYLCENNGVKEYKNTGDTKGCKKISLPALTVTSPARSAPAASGGNANKSAPATPGDFPKVDGGTQKKRDDDRRHILQGELNAEQQKLAELQKAYGNGALERQGNERNYAKYQERVEAMKQDVNRAQHNVNALNRELSNLK